MSEPMTVWEIHCSCGAQWTQRVGRTFRVEHPECLPQAGVHLITRVSWDSVSEWLGRDLRQTLEDLYAEREKVAALQAKYDALVEAAQPLVVTYRGRLTEHFYDPADALMNVFAEDLEALAAALPAEPEAR